MLILQNCEEVKASVAEWQLHLVAFEKEMPSVKAIVQSLSKEHNALDQEVLRVESQLVECRQLFSSATAKLRLLQVDVDAKKARVMI